VVWGRRRVGKTFLMLHVLDRLPRDALRLYHAATQQAEHVELARFTASVERDLGPDVAALAGGGFTSWEAALRFLVALGRQRPLAVVLDEVTYLAASTPGFASIVQSVWDPELPTGASSLMLALTGSSVGTVERMLGGQGALHRRPTLELRLDPVDLPATAEFLPRLEPQGLIEAYRPAAAIPCTCSPGTPTPAPTRTSCASQARRGACCSRTRAACSRGITGCGRLPANPRRGRAGPHTS
jgi:hypothetical protein